MLIVGRYINKEHSAPELERCLGLLSDLIVPIRRGALRCAKISANIGGRQRLSKQSKNMEKLQFEMSHIYGDFSPHEIF